MHLVDRHRPLAPGVVRRAVEHPVLVAPLVLAVGPDDRRRVRRHLEVAGRTDRPCAAGARPACGPRTCSSRRRCRSGTKISQTPDGTSRRIDVRAAVPAVEVADDADALRVGRPDREVHAGDAVDRQAMRAELLPRAVVRPFAEQMQIEVGEDLAELVGIDDVAGDGAFAHAEAVGEVLGAAVERDRRLEQPVGAAGAACRTPGRRVTSCTSDAAGCIVRTTSAGCPSTTTRWRPSTANGSSLVPATIASSASSSAVRTANGSRLDDILLGSRALLVSA